MPTMTTRDGANITYDVVGSGFPVLLFAPGGLRSAMSFWANSEWNPITALSDTFTVVAMDQRNAGTSTGPVTADDGWHTFTSDHQQLMDHLGFERFHVLGGCIGGPYCLGIMQAVPERVAAAVLQQSIGFDNNRETFYGLFDSWATALVADRSDVTQEALAAFRSNLFDQDFVFNVDRDFVRNCQTPMLVLMGDDIFHPQATSREIASLAPHAQLVEDWKSPGQIEATVSTVREFLLAHTPAD